MTPEPSEIDQLLERRLLLARATPSPSAPQSRAFAPARRQCSRGHFRFGLAAADRRDVVVVLRPVPERNVRAIGNETPR